MKLKNKKVLPSLGIALAFTLFVYSADLLLQNASNDVQLETIAANDANMQLNCLAQNIYWEARGEPLAGKIAVAQVTLNRAVDERFEDSVCGVVFERTKTRIKEICQFSWVCSIKNAAAKIDPELYETHKEIARLVLFENVRITHLSDALYFHSDSVRPGWNKNRIMKIGKHIFYREHKGKL